MKKILITLIIVINSSCFFAQDYKFGKISKEELEEAYYPLDSSANAAILYKSRDTHFDYNQGQGFQVITEIQRNDPNARIIIMGDFNDNPDSDSVKSLAGNSLYNPMELLHTQISGSLSYKGDWNLFDQMLLSNNFLQCYS